jgi:hypothetical protein
MPKPKPDDLAALKKAAWAEFEAWLDEYIAKYSAAVDRIMKASLRRKRRPRR